MGNVRREQDEPIIAEFWYRIYPEIRHFQSREELREAKKPFRKTAKDKRRVLGAVVVGFLGIAISRYAGHWLRSLGASIWLAYTGTLVVAALVIFFGSLFLWHRPYVRFVRQYLQDRGVAVCLKCGYDLRGLSAPRCPECGHRFDANLLRRDES